MAMLVPVEEKLRLRVYFDGNFVQVSVVRLAGAVIGNSSTGPQWWADR
jgi:hypothetical protein